MQMNTKLLPIAAAATTFMVGATILVLSRATASQNAGYAPSERSSAAEMIDAARDEALESEGGQVDIAESASAADLPGSMDVSSFELIKKGQDALGRDPPDYRGAGRLFEKAALAGERKAMEMAASLYEESPSPFGNRIRAYAWWTVAQAFGSDVERRRELLTELMTEAEVKSGHRMAQQNLNLIRRIALKERSKK